MVMCLFVLSDVYTITGNITYYQYEMVINKKAWKDLKCSILHVDLLLLEFISSVSVVSIIS